MNGLTELERQQQPHKSRLFPSLQDKYLPVFFYFISAILIVFDFSLSLRRLSPPGCCCINVGTREKKMQNVHFNSSIISLWVLREHAGEESAGLQFDKCIFCLLLWYGKVMRFFLSVVVVDFVCPTKFNGTLSKWESSHSLLNRISLKVDFNHFFSLIRFHSSPFVWNAI